MAYKDSFLDNLALQDLAGLLEDLSEVAQQYPRLELGGIGILVKDPLSGDVVADVRLDRKDWGSIAVTDINRVWVEDEVPA